MCALVAVQRNQEMKHYYETKVAAGKSKMLVLNNVRNKMVKLMFAVVHRGTPYVDPRSQKDIKLPKDQAFGLEEAI